MPHLLDSNSKNYEIISVSIVYVLPSYFLYHFCAVPTNDMNVAIEILAYFFEGTELQEVADIVRDIE